MAWLVRKGIGAVKNNNAAASTGQFPSNRLYCMKYQCFLYYTGSGKGRLTMA
jgi:hypothetical protein